MTTSPEAVTGPEHEPRSCDASLSRAFEFLGKRWNGVLLGTLIQGPAGFAELKRGLGISDSMLSDRLLPALQALTTWAQENLTAEQCTGAGERLVRTS